MWDSLRADCVRDAYTTLANATPQLRTLVSSPLDIKPGSSNRSSMIFPVSSQAAPTLNVADYPSLQFWNKSAWKKHVKSTKDTTTVNQKAAKKGSTRAADGENVTMQFVEDADGRMIDGYRAGEIRKHARSIFNDIAKYTSPPATWGAASSIMRDYYHQQMYRRFPEVQYCDLDWKAEKIASEAYTHWTPPETTVTPVKREADATSDHKAHSKRSHSPTAPPVKLIKKRKTAAIQHEPTSATTSAQSAPAPVASTTILVPPVTDKLLSCAPTGVQPKPARGLSAQAPEPGTSEVNLTTEPEKSGEADGNRGELEVPMKVSV